VLTVFVVIAACGGTAKPGSTARPDEDARDRQMSHMGGDHQMAHKGKGDKPGGEMSGMPPQIAKFHDTLAPRWHAERGPQRMVDTCAAIPQFHRDSEAIAKAEPPSNGDAAAWSKGGKKLTEAVAALDSTCRSKDAQAFESAFGRVHEIFHGLMEAVGGPDEHDEHGEHGEAGDKDREQSKNEKSEHHR